MNKIAKNLCPSGIHIIAESTVHLHVVCWFMMTAVEKIKQNAENDQGEPLCKGNTWGKGREWSEEANPEAESQTQSSQQIEKQLPKPLYRNLSAVFKEYGVCWGQYARDSANKEGRTVVDEVREMMVVRAHEGR